MNHLFCLYCRRMPCVLFGSDPDTELLHLWVTFFWRGSPTRITSKHHFLKQPMASDTPEIIKTPVIIPGRSIRLSTHSQTSFPHTWHDLLFYKFGVTLKRTPGVPVEPGSAQGFSPLCHLRKVFHAALTSSMLIKGIWTLRMCHIAGHERCRDTRGLKAC